MRLCINADGQKWADIASSSGGHWELDILGRSRTREGFYTPCTYVYYMQEREFINGDARRGFQVMSLQICLKFLFVVLVILTVMYEDSLFYCRKWRL